MDVQFDFKVPVVCQGGAWDSRSVAPTHQVCGTSRYLWSCYCEPGAVPGAGATAMKQNRQIILLSGEVDSKQKNII